MDSKINIKVCVCCRKRDFFIFTFSLKKRIIVPPHYFWAFVAQLLESNFYPIWWRWESELNVIRWPLKLRTLLFCFSEEFSLSLYVQTSNYLPFLRAFLHFLYAWLTFCLNLVVLCFSASSQMDHCDPLISTNTVELLLFCS